MSQPLHLRAPATHAKARIAPRPAIRSSFDDRSPPSALAIPSRASACPDMHGASWPCLPATAMAKQPPARNA